MHRGTHSQRAHDVVAAIAGSRARGRRTISCRGHHDERGSDEGRDSSGRGWVGGGGLFPDVVSIVRQPSYQNVSTFATIDRPLAHARYGPRRPLRAASRRPAPRDFPPRSEPIRCACISCARVAPPDQERPADARASGVDPRLASFACCARPASSASAKSSPAMTSVRRDCLDARFPGLLDSVLSAL